MGKHYIYMNHAVCSVLCSVQCHDECRLRVLIYFTFTIHKRLKLVNHPFTDSCIRALQ